MKKSLVRKGLVVGIIVLFVGASVIPSMGGAVVEKHVSIDNETSYRPINNRGDTLYVGGSGPNNYSKIQDAINDASNGDTVFVYDDSSPYYENVVVDKSINLLGENRNTTVINGSGVGDVVLIDADWVNISGFTIRNSYHDLWAGTGIVIRSDYNTITGNDISKNVYGIGLWFSSNNITGNIISNNQHGIKLRQSNCNTITGNNITSNAFVGIWLEDACNNNTIYHNNFINNGENAFDKCDNTWDDGEYGNYWSDYEERYPFARKIWLKGIWNTPYKIPCGDNKDMYPLIKQWPDSVSKTKPENKPFNFNFPLLSWLFERFPNAFPILRHMLGL